MRARVVPYWSGKRIEHLRRLLGSAANALSYNELAEVLAGRGCDVHPKQLARWERDERLPQVAEAIAIAEAAGVSVGWFVLGVEKAPELPHGATKAPRHGSSAGEE